jgi:imidazoleglycerol phosphate synthase glutamine amidotransferase subunit HisH
MECILKIGIRFYSKTELFEEMFMLMSVTFIFSGVHLFHSCMNEVGAKALIKVDFLVLMKRFVFLGLCLGIQIHQLGMKV